MQQRLVLIATDFVTLYQEALSRQLLTPAALTPDAFKDLFDRINVEYMHYAGAGATQPYFEDVVENLLQLAAAYITLPPDAAPNSRAFGVYLTFFLYATQPAIETSPVKVQISLGTLQRYVDDIDSTARDNQGVITSLGCRVSDGEKRLLLALHKAGALKVMPFIDDSLYVRTLIEVHEQAGLPLLTCVAPQRSNPSPHITLEGGTCVDDDLSNQLHAYREMRRRINTESLLKRK
ncbi:hypothetical protein, conserved [Trypanosoma brucei gambiense DAL972]|uniref:Small nuclear RNA-activating protein n=2 Tax=Trypanosoma brucei TaxID=5691 RepID=D0A3C8_TRYB9|nr:hypothetical protein, conserved [Trypanosoma brucei gambiense DAL972]RHW69918.1 small nuclear RNA-activating protein [Trypanosoma brucei equiperdum]CBH15772.1 hypothetical protein, conserved [Trypanosoma brucei gambiense DAL972]|eukprot:XP_011778036.1 hypothetical protein, conserved [Trypanosoma brucei gambiense DAL972]